jgi:hypothetical protein
MNRLVTYEEAAGFIYTANKMVPNERYRPQFYVYPPSGKSSRSAVLSDLRLNSGRRVVFDVNMKRHYFIESAAGIRLADLHLGSQPLAVYVPYGEKLYVRESRSSREYLVPNRQRVALSELRSQERSARKRGAEHESFRLLFKTPYDNSAMRAYRNRAPEKIASASSSRVSDWLRPTLGVSALAILGVGGLLTGLAAREKDSVDGRTSNRESQSVNRTISRYNTGAITCYIVGAAAVAGYLTWKFWPSKKVNITVSPSTRGGGQINLWSNW